MPHTGLQRHLCYCVHSIPELAGLCSIHQPASERLHPLRLPLFCCLSCHSTTPHFSPIKILVTSYACCCLFCHSPHPVGLYFRSLLLSFWASLVAQLVKKLPAVWETWVRSLSWDDPLEKGKANHSSILAWRNLKESDATEWLSLIERIALLYIHYHV